MDARERDPCSRKSIDPQEASFQQKFLKKMKEVETPLEHESISKIQKGKNQKVSQEEANGYQRGLLV